MSENKKIIDADLHVQDPHEIILGYFNTSNDAEITKGSYSNFKKNIVILTIVLILMKFFFQEMFVSTFFTFLVLISSVLIALVSGFILPFFIRIIHHSSKSGIAGILQQLVFISLIVIALGLFI
jgi:hypothetical protein